MSTAALEFFHDIEPLARELFRVQSDFRWHDIHSLVSVRKPSEQSIGDRLKKFRLDSRAADFSCSLVAGSILQLAFFVIDNYGCQKSKSIELINHESEINQLLALHSKNRIADRKKMAQFEFPKKFCVGRSIGILPIGVIVYAGRNQYNHFDKPRLEPVNEHVFDYLRCIFPKLSAKHSFNPRGSKRPLSHSIVWALDWIDSDSGSGYEKFQIDMFDVMGLPRN